MKMLFDTIANFFRSLQPLEPAIAGAGASRAATPQNRYGNKVTGMMFASGSGSGDGGGDDYDDFADEDYVEPAQETRRNPGAPRSRAGGSGSGGGGGGRQRTIDFQPEERYWTEYLRIALPIIGLLLMIGLFWYWAAQLTSDDKPNDPVGTQLPGTTEVITPPSTPLPTKPPVIQPTTPSNTPVAEATNASGDEGTTPSTDQTTPAGETGDYAEGDTVVVSDGPVNMRDDASTDGNIVASLETDTELSIVSGPTKGGDYQWYEVVVQSEGDSLGKTGWVAADFLTLAP